MAAVSVLGKMKAQKARTTLYELLDHIEWGIAQQAYRIFKEQKEQEEKFLWDSLKKAQSLQKKVFLLRLLNQVKVATIIRAELMMLFREEKSRILTPRNDSAFFINGRWKCVAIFYMDIGRKINIEKEERVQLEEVLKKRVKQLVPLILEKFSHYDD